MRLRCALLLAALIAAFPAKAGRTAIDDAASAMQELRRQALGAPPVCTFGQGTIVYVGPTDQSLLDCIQAHPQARNLQIASLGGPVTPAIAAARIIAARAIEVTVAGFCASSCGNYVAAAARKLTVLADSAITLHGAPLADGQAMREQAVNALLRAGFTEAELTDAFVEHATGQLREQRAQHEAFAADFAVGREWYDLTAYYAALEKMTGDGPMLIVSPEFARACLGHPEIGDFWFPRSEPEAERLEQIAGGPLMLMGRDLPAPASCGQ